MATLAVCHVCALIWGMSMKSSDGGRVGMFKLIAASVLGAGLVTGVPLIGQAVSGATRPAVTAPTPAGRTPAGTTPASVALPAQPRVVPQTKADAISSYAPIVRRSSPAVVNVYARSIQRGRVAVDFFGGAFRIPDRASQSQGSGVIVRDDGIIVTNNHVVEGATELVVVLGDRREFPATIVLTDPRTDLAVLRIDAKGERLSSLKFADTTTAQVGDQVLAIGNPFGVGQTVTGGIISALARTDTGITDYSFFIQTDASINPGNSGGALVDMNGDLVGVNTAIFSRSGTSAGVGFAIPAEMVKRVVEGAVKDGKVIRAWSGIRGQSVDAEIARTMGLAKPGGVLVTEVYAGSAGAQAGLRRGDVVTGFAGALVNDYNGLRFQAATRAPGERVAFTYLRQGQTTTGQGVLSAPPGTNAQPELLSGRHIFDGASVATLTPAVAEQLGLDPFTKGVVVVSISNTGASARVGLQPGDIVLDTNDSPISSVNDLQSRLRDGTQGRVTLQRGEQRISATLFL
jgi:Do/DeqQ family serine protease